MEDANSQDGSVPLRSSTYGLAKGIVDWICMSLTAAGIVVFVLYAFNVPFVGGHVLMQGQYLALILMFFLPQGFLLFPVTKGARRDKIPWYDILLAVLSTLGPVFVVLTRKQTELLGWSVSPPITAVILGWLTIVLLIELGRRTAGLSFMVVLVFFTCLPFFANYMPGYLAGIAKDARSIAGFNLLGTQAILGMPTSIMGDYMVPLLLFSAVVQLSGAGRFILNLAFPIVGGIRGGAAKVAVLGSAMFASVNGSAIANVLTTGCVTIPMMKKQGYPPVYAGAVEAVASNGGVMTPPIMGAVAFLMAEFLGITYTTVALAAAVPAFMYYLAVMVQTDMYAAKTKLPPVPRSQIPPLGKTLKEGWFLSLGLIVFVYLVFILWWHVSLACIFSIVAMLLFSYLRKDTRVGPRGLLQIVKQSATLFAQTTPLLAGAGMIVGSLVLTGTGGSISHMVAGLAGKSVILMVLLAGISAFILGMGMVISAVYILVAILVAPGLTAAGGDTLAVHIFLCWWASLSTITPPVATAAIAAASLAGADYQSIGFRAVRLGIVAYIVPIVCVFRPQLVLHGEPLDILAVIGITSIAVIFLSASLEGYMYGMGKINPLRRFLFTAAGLMLFIAGNVPLNLLGLGLGAALILQGINLRQLLSRKTRREQYLPGGRGKA